jgi:Lamin Tail Domain/FlgD Ig-like domain
MRKLYIFFLFLLFVTTLISQNVVINEVLYDPAGSDGGYEWIELYNNSDSAINLAGWHFEKAGSDFEYVFFFATYIDYWVYPNSYYLIGEEFVQNCDLIENLAFQNGGTATDGIRLISSDTLYTDTVLYDSPNTNNLPDDISNPGLYFAVDVAGGNSLARIQNGVDTENCELDFFECSNPTPGEPNFYPIDLAIYDLELTLNNDEYWLQTEVFNLSTQNVDNSTASLEITVNNSSYGSYYLPAIPALGSVTFEQQISLPAMEYCVVEAEIIFLYDNELENNFAAISILLEENPILINELLFKPESGNQEWIEIYNRSECVYVVDNLQIMDASGGIISFDGSLQPNGFLVVCQDANLLFQTYPNCNQNLVIEADDWTSLNNTEEILILMDEYDTVFDSLSYNGNSCPSNYSFERVNPFDDEHIQWLVCQDSSGGTPTFHNSVLPINKDLDLKFVEIYQENSNIEHKLRITNIGLENIESAEINCYKREVNDISSVNVYSDFIELADTLKRSFYTDLPSTGYYEFQYEIISDEDLNATNDNQISHFNNRGLPFVINEIMYAPQNDMPEWIELKFNSNIENLVDFYLVVDEDTLQITNPDSESEFMIITYSQSDIDTLQAVYGLEGIPMVKGLSSLSNSGEQLELYDNCNNLIESFFFFPEWNNAISGTSIERINSNLLATENNWGPSVNICSPGEENSIFVEVLPSKMKLSVDPNPFSPYRGEYTIFSFKLPQVISRVTLRIFDLKGRMLRKLVNQQLQASKGNIVWDGRGDNGKKLSVGVYIVLMEATSYETEKVYNKKITVVIGK